VSRCPACHWLTEWFVPVEDCLEPEVLGTNYSVVEYGALSSSDTCIPVHVLRPEIACVKNAIFMHLFSAFTEDQKQVNTDGRIM
jgi:hypothetical protein